MYGNPNATQGFIWREITWPPGLLESKNNNKVSRVFFGVIFYVYTNVDNREQWASPFVLDMWLASEKKVIHFTYHRKSFIEPHLIFD